MRIPRLLKIVAALAIVVGLGVAAFFTRSAWMPLLASLRAPAPAAAEESEPVKEPTTLKLTSQGRKNLGLVVKPLKPQSYWRTLQIPGEIVDRPGRTDRGVTSPAVGVVSEVHAFPGDTLKPGDPLFSMRLFSEYLQNTQSELFKATRETELIREQYARLEGPAQSGAVAESRLIELNNQLRRQTALIQAYRQDLLTRGLNPSQIAEVAEGRFVTTVEIVAPPPVMEGRTAPDTPATLQPVAFLDERGAEGPTYEVQELSVELGQQVQAGQLLAVLANHTALYIEGHAFKSEATALERAAQNAWPVNVEFAEDDRENWPPLEQTFHIRHLANAIDAASRTFDFFIPLTNQSRSYRRDDRQFVVWRFRPGQRVRLFVPIEKFENALVVPASAVVREGPEAYVFQQNGDLFNRLPVHVLYEDRENVALADDGSVKPGYFIAQGSAASLNRVLKAQAASGVRADVHVHADGTTHEAH